MVFPTHTRTTPTRKLCGNAVQGQSSAQSERSTPLHLFLDARRSTNRAHIEHQRAGGQTRRVTRCGRFVVQGPDVARSMVFLALQTNPAQTSCTESTLRFSRDQGTMPLWQAGLVRKRVGTSFVGKVSRNVGEFPNV